MTPRLTRAKDLVKGSLELLVSPRLADTAYAHNLCEKLNKRSKERVQRERQKL